jgi:hypothetical protein
VIGRGRCRNHQLARCTGHARCDGIIPVCAARRGLACGRPTAATVYLCLCKRQRQQSNNCSRYRLPGTQNGGIIKHCAAPDLPFGRPFTVSALCCHCSPAPHPACLLLPSRPPPDARRPHPRRRPRRPLLATSRRCRSRSPVSSSRAPACRPISASRPRPAFPALPPSPYGRRPPPCNHRSSSLLATMCLKVVHKYGCGHEHVATAPCATSKTSACGVNNVKTVKHEEKCETCDH